MVITQKAYIPSAKEYDEVFNKFRAFVSMKLSAKAKKAGAWRSDTYGTGYFFTRTPLAGSSDLVYYGDSGGARGWDFANNNNAGLCVAFNLIYNPKSNLVRGCKMETRTALVYGDSPVLEWESWQEDKEVTSTAPIVKYGGRKCLWINKEECENGTEQIMRLWPVDLIARAVPFDRTGHSNDYGKAEELQKQCYDELTANCTQEELDMLVEMEMSSEDNYEKTTPKFTEKQKEILKAIKQKKDHNDKTTQKLSESQLREFRKIYAEYNLRMSRLAGQDTTSEEVMVVFKQLLEGKIDEEGLRAGLKSIVDKLASKKGVKKEELTALVETIKKGYADYKNRLADLNKEKEDLYSLIDNLNLGGD